MKINTRHELDFLLKQCKAVPYSDVREGSGFLKVKSQSFLYPNGSIQNRDYIEKKKASVVVPITADGNVVLVVQPIGLSKEGSLVEFPAGYWELNENGEQAGIRELSEETGYVPEQIIYLGEHYQDPGGIRQTVDVYLALGCKGLNEQKLDKGEYIKHVEVPYELALELMDEGYFKDANSYIGLSKTDRYLMNKYKIEYNSGAPKKY